MNIEFKTPKEIREHAEKVLELFNSTGKKLYKDIYDACQNELKRRSQKKSMEPSANQGQLPDIGERREQENKAEFFKEKQQRTPIRDAAAKVPQEIKDEVEEWAEKVEREASKQMQQNPVMPAPQPKALTKIPAPTKPIKWANGKVYEMNELDLRRKSIDYFSDVLNGKREPKDFYRSMQFNNLVRFQIGLYRFGNEVMEHKVLHPTFEMCKKETQERSEELYRQVVEYWKQYKDTDIV